jgi:preprotein translocase subunit SecG
MEVFIVYALLLIFFIGLIPVLLLVVKEQDPRGDKQIGDGNKGQKTKESKTGTEKTAYGVLGAIMAMVLVLTILMQRSRN